MIALPGSSVTLSGLWRCGRCARVVEERDMGGDYCLACEAATAQSPHRGRFPVMSTRRRRASAIRAQLDECIAAARREGYVGTDAEYEYTQEDLDSIVAYFGAKPTLAQWHAAGLKWVGSAHTA